MGAWGTGIFDNDDALDWVFELESHVSVGFIERTLDAVLSVGADYLEAPEASRALAAADAVTRLQGHRGDWAARSETFEKWVESARPMPGPELIGKAVAAINRILSDRSELLELWEEGGVLENSKAWRSSVAEVKSRLLG